MYDTNIAEEEDTGLNHTPEALPSVPGTSSDDSTHK